MHMPVNFKLRTIARERERFFYSKKHKHYKISLLHQLRSSQIIVLVLNKGNYNSVSFAILSIWCWQCIMTPHMNCFHLLLCWLGKAILLRYLNFLLYFLLRLNFPNLSSPRALKPQAPNSAETWPWFLVCCYIRLI